MAPLNQAEKDILSAQISQELTQTRYICSSLTGLGGGTTNFVFRGTLAQPFLIQDGSTNTSKRSVIIKHATDFASINRDFPLDATRCGFEEFMLNALHDFPSVTTVDGISLKTPHLYLFNDKTNTQVIEDVPDALDLKSVFISLTANNLLYRSLAISIGRALGSWLRSFHAWASAPAQADLRKKIGENEPMRRLKSQITYERIIQVLENFPDIIEGHRNVLEDVQYLAGKEFEKRIEDEDSDDWGIIHGDFWTGNVLLPNTLSLDIQQSRGIDVFIIDWEFVQFGHHAYDLGQMIGDLYERKHNNNVADAIWAIQGFMDGYGELTEEMAYRVAIHAGVHLICWYTRRDPKSPLPFPLEHVRDLLKLGRDFVVKAWEKDRVWFESSALAPLFMRK